MRVRLKGINSRRKRLATGEVVTYWYAWKGGPRLAGAPGSPEFVASYNAAVATRFVAPTGVLLSILNGFQASEDFRSLAERTRLDYAKIIRTVEIAFGDFPLSAMSDRRTVGEFMAWRDQMAARSRRQADYHWAVLARILAWALRRGLVTANPCEKGGRLYRATRAEKVWTAEDERRFLEVASPQLAAAMALALWTGQRQGDLLRLAWSAFDGERIRLRQSKTGARVVIPAGQPLKAVLAELPKVSPVILVSSDGRPWTADGFRSSWRKATRKAGITDLTFNDLRGTAVTRLALAECTEAEIATITGHSLRDVRSILDAHYLHRDPALGESAIRKLETRTKIPDRAPDRS